jgi:hypothetical protein
MTSGRNSGSASTSGGNGRPMSSRMTGRPGRFNALIVRRNSSAITGCTSQGAGPASRYSIWLPAASARRSCGRLTDGMPLTTRAADTRSGIIDAHASA